MKNFNERGREEHVTPHEVTAEDSLYLTSREFVELSGARIHLFVDSCEGPRQIIAPELRQARVERALQRLRDMRDMGETAISG